MHESVTELLKAWRGMSLTNPPYILDGDKIEKGYWHKYKSFSGYIKDSNNRNNVKEVMCKSFPDDKRDSKVKCASPKKFHSGLIPVPYGGDIRKAKIYILTLNPGLRPIDYYAESHDKAYRKARIRQLRQRNLDKDFPFMELNPKVSWKSKYWTGRLGDIIQMLQEQKNVSYTKALSLLSKSIAYLEYIPYHSENFGIKKSVINKMRSPKLIKAFVDDYVFSRAKKGKANIIVTRKVDWWLTENQRKELKGKEFKGEIVIYNTTESRGSYLNSKSRGGKMIAKAMGIEFKDNN